MRPPAPNGRWRALTLAAVIAGVTFQLAQYLSCQSYWQDESALLLNLAHKPVMAVLFGPLDAVPLAQAAPPLFLLISKLLLTYAGSGEYVMRLPPLLCGLAALPLFAFVCFRLLPAHVVPWAVSLFACSNSLIFEAATLKPYTGDVLAAVALFCAVLGMDDDEAAWRKLARTAAVAVLFMGLAYTSALVFAAISLALLPRFSRARLNLYAILNLAPAATFLFLLRACVRPQRSPMLVRFWHDRFVDWSRPLYLFPWFAARIWELFLYVEALPAGALLVPLALPGVVWLWRTQPRWRFGALTLPLLLAILAAAAHQYPLGGGRVSLFLLPPLIVYAAAGLAWASAQARPIAVIGYCLCGVVVVYAAARDIQYMIQPRYNGASRQVISFVREHRTGDQPIEVLEGMGEDMLWMWPDAAGQIDINARPDRYPPHGRYWVMYVYKMSRGPAEMRRIAARTDGHVIQQFACPGGAAQLIEAPEPI